MKRIVLCFWICIVCAAFLGSTDVRAEGGVIYQLSTMAALKEGRYKGGTSFGELKNHGDFGLGTLDHLDGEMIALDGSFFQVKADGKVHAITDSATTPFAVVTFLKPDRTLAIRTVRDLKSLLKALDDSIPDPDAMYAIRIDGRFKHVKARSVPRQEEPFPTLSEALRSQKVFELNGVLGTLVGFRFPEYMNGVNVAGYHFHCITSDRKAGGHILDCSLENVKVSLHTISEFSMTILKNGSEARMRSRSIRKSGAQEGAAE